MKFLMVATFAWPDHYGGAERVIGEVATRLVARGHDVTLLTSDTGGLPAREMRDGVRVMRYAVERGSPARFYRAVFRGVRSALREASAGADLLHVHQPLSGVAAVAPGAVRPAPVISSFYAPYHQEFLARFREGRPDGAVPASARAVSAVLRHGDRYLLRRSRRVLVLSRFSRDQVARLCPEALARTTVAPAGADLERFRPARDHAERCACRTRFGLSEAGGPVILSVRRLVPRMGLSDLLQACRILGDAGPPWQLAIAGEGPLAGELGARAGEAGLAGRVRLLGRVPDDALPELYRAADVFVLPSRALEGFGMATAEALASGLPVVATRAGASAELLEGLDGAALCPVEEPAALAAALAPLLATPDARTRAGEAARRHAEQHLPWEHHLRAVEEAARGALTDA